MAKPVRSVNNAHHQLKNYCGWAWVLKCVPTIPTYVLVWWKKKSLNRTLIPSLGTLIGVYIDNYLGTAPYSRIKLEQLINFVNDFIAIQHTTHLFTWKISETSVSFLDILVSIRDNAISHFWFLQANRFPYLMIPTPINDSNTHFW